MSMGTPLFYFKIEVIIWQIFSGQSLNKNLLSLLFQRNYLKRNFGRNWNTSLPARSGSKVPGIFQDGGSPLHLLYSANCPLRDESGKNQLTGMRIALHEWHFYTAVFVLNFALLSFRRDSFSLARIMRKPAFVCWRSTEQNRTNSCFSTIRFVLIHWSPLFLLF